MMKIANFFVSLTFRLTLVFFLAILINTIVVKGQCIEPIEKKNAFSKVSREFRSVLIERFEELLNYKCKKNFKELYRLLTPSFRQLNTEKDFVENCAFYYEGNDGFVSFKIQTVGQTISPLDKKPDVWLIKGCLTEKIKGNERSIEVIFEAIRDFESGVEKIFFADVTTRPYPLGKNQKCKI